MSTPDTPHLPVESGAHHDAVPTNEVIEGEFIDIDAIDERTPYHNPDEAIDSEDDDGLGAVQVGSAGHNALTDLGNQRIVLPESSTRGQAISHLSRNVTLNEYNLPTFFYRSDLLPFDLGQLTQADADAATVTMDYGEGYPTFSGKIFWFQLPHEPFEAFTLFQRYLDQAEEVGLRQLQLLSMSQSVSFDKISELAQEYYWSWRSRAYDLFQVAAERKRRESRARRLENVQYERSTMMLDQLMEKFSDPDWIEKLDTREAIDALFQLTKIQRMAVGLPANGNAGTQAVDPMMAASGAQLLQDITKGITLKTEGIGLNEGLQALMMDPNFSMQAQSLILQIRRGTPQTDAQLEHKQSAVRDVE